MNGRKICKYFEFFELLVFISLVRKLSSQEQRHNGKDVDLTKYSLKVNTPCLVEFDQVKEQDENLDAEDNDPNILCFKERGHKCHYA